MMIMKVVGPTVKTLIWKRIIIMTRTTVSVITAIITLIMLQQNNKNAKRMKNNNRKHYNEIKKFLRLRHCFLENNLIIAR